MICDQCETVAHCLKNGCVPKQPTKDKALKLALEALEDMHLVELSTEDLLSWNKAVKAIKQALLTATPLAAPVQEPVGWFKYDKVSGCWHPQYDEFAPTHAVREGWKQLYTNPPAAQQRIQELEAELMRMQGRELKFAMALNSEDPPAAQRPWIGLTDDEFRDFATTLDYGTGGLIRAIEAKLKEKNT